MDTPSTMLPRNVSGTAPDEAPVRTLAREVPQATTAGVCRTALRYAVSWQAVVLAAYARVLATLSGETTVVTGCRDAAGTPVRTRRLAVDGGTWAALVRSAETALGAAPELAPADPDTVLDLADETPTGDGEAEAGATGTETGDPVLRVGLAWVGDRLWLRLRYRTDAIDDRYAERLAGYHLAALSGLVSDPQGTHRGCRLVSESELWAQRAVLNGPHRPLPARLVHELVADRARRHPDVIALVYRGESCTYGELDQRANRIAHALVRAGVGREDVVAVVTERDPDWAAAVLAVLKAGAAYLPVEPGYPPARIAGMLEQAGCRHALTTAGCDANLPGGTGLTVVRADLAGRTGRADPLNLPTTGDQLAYVFFTSGSTGSPKGVMCEHAGLLNHVRAKIADLAIGPGSVVAQVAPQCFDISLWQLLAALTMGGRTVIVEADAVPDPERFLRIIAHNGVEVLQVVPSYLDTLLTHLSAHPRELAALRMLSATGEELKRELAARWFAAFPQVPLVNAYGLTETCDDTHHEVMAALPDFDRVPLGRPIPNVEVRLVDEFGAPVPWGAPGEIVFGGVCVARGYINDLERTAAAFDTGAVRGYRSGDYGRLLPDGRLEFLGRRDNQIKIDGCRVELGEVENALLRVPGVRDAAVVVAGGGSPYLVAFFRADGELPGDTIRVALRETLAPYMVPQAYRQLEALPLTVNGKVDRAALAALAVPSPVGPTPPRTPTERWLAGLWAEVLNTTPERIGRDHSFFDLGTSLAAIRLLIGLERRITLRELADTPVLADLGRLVDARGGVLTSPRIGATTTRPRAEAVAAPAPAGPGYGGLDVTLADRRPPVVRVTGDPADWLADRRPELDALVAAHGAALVRGLGLADPQAVRTAVAALSAAPMEEREGFAGRDRYGPGLYSSAHWPADAPMCMHHEMSYARTVPGRVFVACLRPADEGGITGVADSREVAAALPTDLLARLDRDGWLLRRVYREHIGVGWPAAFGTTDPVEVEAYCAAAGIEAVWAADGTLRTTQRRSVFVTHPVTGARCWFNQLAFLNAATMAPAVRGYLEAEYGPDGLPFDTFHSDGEPIGGQAVEMINAAYDNATRREPWAAGDLLVIDNIRTAHSREPYRGRRDVVVALTDPVEVVR